VQAVDFALICATHRRLKDEVEAGRFRADLYYRLNGLTLALPPLRERDDFDTLTRRLLNEISPDLSLTLSPGVARALAAYHWPGNLRQLANALRTAAALLDHNEQCIEWAHLPEDLAEELVRPAPAATCSSGPESDNLRILSRSAMDRAIATAGGNLSEAARRLGISRNTLYRKLKNAAA
jgi:transcriptional regulator of acetoin/glycerol metabolism